MGHRPRCQRSATLPWFGAYLSWSALDSVFIAFTTIANASMMNRNRTKAIRPTQPREERCGFCDRPRLRRARIPTLPRLVRGQSEHFRRRPRGRAQAVGGGRSHLASRQALLFRRRAHHAEAGAEADPVLCGFLLEAVDRIG